jgi:hypothetical protein
LSAKLGVVAVGSSVLAFLAAWALWVGLPLRPRSTGLGHLLVLTMVLTLPGSIVIGTVGGLLSGRLRHPPWLEWIICLVAFSFATAATLVLDMGGGEDVIAIAGLILLALAAVLAVSIRPRRRALLAGAVTTATVVALDAWRASWPPSWPDEPRFSLFLLMGLVVGSATLVPVLADWVVEHFLPPPCG